MKVLLIPLTIIWIILLIVYFILDKPYCTETAKDVKILEYVMYIIAVIIVIILTI